MSESAFFQDLAMLMTAAGFVAVIFSRLGWPKVLGYILAGILLGEHTWGGSLLADASSIRTIGQLGVVFLMFAMGLSFSPREMKKIKAVALPCAAVDTIAMIWLGYTLGTRVFGWSPVQALFLGVAICDSATTLLAKVIDEMGWSARPFAKYVLGTSVCEDIVCVGAIAVATGFAQGEGMSALTFLGSLGWLAVFLLAVVVFGLILVPRLLTSVGRRRDDEATVLVTLGCCFFVSYVAYKWDYSLALGAFLVGVLCALSDLHDRIERLVEPLKAMFAAVFFVSIGLLVNPAACWHNLPAILAVSGVILVGKALNNAFVSLATGLDVKTAIQNGLGLAQIGEFAFMVAILYVGLVHDSSSPMFQIAVGASLLTTLANPFLLRFSDPVGDWALAHLPARFGQALATYGGWLEKMRSSRGSPESVRIRSALIHLGLYAVLVFAAATICSLLYRYDYSRFSPLFERYDRIVFWVVANFFILGMLPLVKVSACALATGVADVLIGHAGSRWVQQTRTFISFVLQAVVFALYFIEWTMINVSIAPPDGPAFSVALGIIIVAGIFGWKFFTAAGKRAVARLNEALSAEDRRERLGRMTTIDIPVDAVHELVIGADSPAVGGTVVTLNIRAKTGASVVSVERDGRRVRNIGPEWEFAIGDHLFALGDNAQIAALKDLLGII